MTKVKTYLKELKLDEHIIAQTLEILQAWSDKSEAYREFENKFLLLNNITNKEKDSIVAAGWVILNIISDKQWKDLLSLGYTKDQNEALMNFMISEI